MDWMTTIAEELAKIKTAKTHKEQTIKSCQERTADDADTAANVEQMRIAQRELEKLEQRENKFTIAKLRLEEDKFGFCIECGDDIPEKRLKADPAVQHCIYCQQEREKRGQHFAA